MWTLKTCVEKKYNRDKREKRERRKEKKKETQNIHMTGSPARTDTGHIHWHCCMTGGDVERGEGRQVTITDHVSPRVADEPPHS